MPATQSTQPPTVLNQRLAGSGLRPTPQREIVYDALLKRRDHPSADELHSRVKSRMPGISLATVYNCLEKMVACGLVRAVNFERGPTHYCPNLRPHAHFHDEETGATHDIDLPASLLAQIGSLLPEGFEARAVEVNFRGSTRVPASRPPVRRAGAARALRQASTPPNFP